MSCQIIVKSVSPYEVKMEAEGFNFTFGLRKGKIKLLSSFRSDAQVHDPSECYLPRALYLKALRQATAILKDHEQRKLNITEKRKLQEMKKRQLREMDLEISSGKRCPKKQCGMKLDYVSQSPCPHCGS